MDSAARTEPTASNSSSQEWHRDVNLRIRASLKTYLEQKEKKKERSSWTSGVNLMMKKHEDTVQQARLTRRRQEAVLASPRTIRRRMDSQKKIRKKKTRTCMSSWTFHMTTDTISSSTGKTSNCNYLSLSSSLINQRKNKENLIQMMTIQSMRSCCNMNW